MKLPAKPCARPGCRAMATDSRRRYCGQHEAEWKQKELARRKRSRRSSQHSGMYNSRWRKARIQYLKQNPFCVSCGQPAEEVDHITPHNGDRRLFWDRSNWSPSCKRCHSRKTASRDGGFGNPRRDS